MSVLTFLCVQCVSVYLYVCLYYPGPTTKILWRICHHCRLRGDPQLWYNTAIQNQPNTNGGIRETSNLVELRFVSGKGGQWGQTERHQGSLAALPSIALGWWAMYGWVDGGRGVVDCRSNTVSLWEEESIKGNGNLLTIKILKHSACRGQESS